MTLAQKLRQLRHLEGDLRGLGRELTQAELVRAIKRDLGETISQSYLSLIEKGSRKHLSHESRQLLARFFKVHPGYLVSDPPGFHTELTSDVATVETALDRGDVGRELHPFRARPPAQRRARPHRPARRVAPLPRP